VVSTKRNDKRKYKFRQAETPGLDGEPCPQTKKDGSSENVSLGIERERKGGRRVTKKESGEWRGPGAHRLQTEGVFVGKIFRPAPREKKDDRGRE